MRKLCGCVVVVIGFLLMGCSERPNKENVEERIDQLLSQMTLQEKIGQMNQLNGRNVDEVLLSQIKNGHVGSILNVEQAELVNAIQRVAVEDSRLGIPILIARDVIHGYKTIFPVPLGQAASFNPEIAEIGSRIAAVEATEDGIRWTFAPMMDVSRDPRWGRMAESFGEDTWLTEVMSLAMIKGFQGDSLSSPTAMAACAKHFIGYGAAEGGRDYNTTHIPERQLRNVYLPPFEAAVAAGCASVMTSFNDNDGVPASGNKNLLTGVLREEWGFDGVVVSDWASVHEMVIHGFSEDDKEAAEMAVNAGLDMEMVSLAYWTYLEELMDEGKVEMKTIDAAVRNILRMKFRLGLFEDPYISLDVNSKAYSPDHLQAAQQAAEESLVLLKNDQQTLPFNECVKTIAIIGPMADAPHDQMGTWVFDGDKNHTVTPLAALKEMFGDTHEFIYEPGLLFSRDSDRSRFPAALNAARKADAVVVFVGEESILSGEAHSLADINLKGAQRELVKLLNDAGKPLVTVVMAGRPLTIGEEVEQSDAVIYAWHPGTMGGPAIANVLFGVVNPSGKLPVTFPKMVGQIPIYYNHGRTGRPARGNEVLLEDIPLEARQSSLGNTSYYLDAGFYPLFPFGYGLSYTKFEYKDLLVEKAELGTADTLRVTIELANTGEVDGVEVVQMYVHDPVASIARPVKELKAFKRVFLEAGETKQVELTLPLTRLAFWGLEYDYKVEAGRYNLMIGGNSTDGLKDSFTIKSQ
jgi:beta-glucosidase